MKNLLKRLELDIEEVILAILILIEVFDFFTLVPPIIELAEKAFAIFGVAYLFYKASITRITFGKHEKKIDCAIILAYLALSAKTVIGFLISASEEKTSLSTAYSVILQNADSIEKICFFLGSIILLLVSAYLIKEKISRPSIMNIIHEDKIAKNIPQKILRFVSNYVVLIAIFVVVFTFVFEWLAMTIDAPVLVIILFFYLFVIVKRGKNMNTESFLKKVSDSSEEFYGKFISLFHAKKTITLAITGLLVLHLLVEIGNFVIPYTTGLMYSWYFSQLGAGHEPLSSLVINDFNLAQTISAQFGVMLIYLMNVLAILALFFGPAYAWTQIYLKKRIKLPNLLWVFFGSLAVFIMMPVFSISELRSPALIGVDITTQQIPFIENMALVLVTSALVMGIFYILGRKNLRSTTKVAFFTVFFYFGIYLYKFFFSLAKNYISTITLLGKNGQYFIALQLLLFFTIIILFYSGGYIMFLYETYVKQKI